MSEKTSRAEIIRQLARQVHKLQQVPAVPLAESGLISSGIAPLDRLLPGRGLNPGTLAEWLEAAPGSGAGELSLRCVSPLQQTGRAFVVVDLPARFYPPAAAALGIDLEETILIRPRYQTDALWALEQVLRCPGVGVVWCWLEQVPERAFRRLQLAAEAGGGLGLLMRPGEMQTRPSWAEVRWLVQPVPMSERSSGRRVRIELLRCRGGARGGAVELEISHETGVVSVAAPLVSATVAGRAVGA